MRVYPETPDKPAVIIAGTDQQLTYAQLEERSIQLAHVLSDAGLRPGDDVALLAENGLHSFEVFWAAMRSGLYLTAINFHLNPDEASYIVNDCAAKALITSTQMATIAT